MPDPTYDELVHTARGKYAQALGKATSARVALLSAGGALFAALRARQAGRLAAAGGDATEVPLPCSGCYREVAPWGDERHTVIVDGSGLPYARCQRPQE